MRHLITLLTVSFLLVSCASTYRNPDGDPASLAVIKNHYKGNPLNPTIFGDEEYVTIYAINGKRVSYDWSWTSGTKKILVAPGNQDLEINVAARKQTVYRQKIVRVQFLAQKGKTYALKGAYSGPDAKFWIEEAETSKKMLPVQSVEMTAVLPVSQAPMIIFLPAG